MPGIHRADAGRAFGFPGPGVLKAVESYGPLITGVGRFFTRVKRFIGFLKHTAAQTAPASLMTLGPLPEGKKLAGPGLGVLRRELRRILTKQAAQNERGQQKQ